jgi:hypothetical protein
MKGNELRVKKKEMTFKNQLKMKKDKMGKETRSFPILSTAPYRCFFYIILPDFLSTLGIFIGFELFTKPIYKRSDFFK